MVQEQRVAVVIQHPHRLFSLHAEVARHGYDGGRRVVGIQPLNGVETQRVDDQHSRAVREPQLTKHRRNERDTGP